MITSTNQSDIKVQPQLGA